MKVRNFALRTVLLTSIALLYVHQNYMIIESNYSIKKYERQLCRLLDRNRKLMYNVTALESPRVLEEKLKSHGVKYVIPRQWAVVSRRSGRSPYYVASTGRTKSALFEKVANFRTPEAEAKLAYSRR